MKKYQFYFDFLSPYSYFGFVKLQRFLGNHPNSIKIVYKPLLMTSLFSHWGITPPGIIPPKRKYVTKVLFELSKQAKIKFSHPKEFPFNSSLILKTGTLVNCENAKVQEQVIKTFFEAVWLKNLNCEEEAEIKELLIKSDLKPDLIENLDPIQTKKELKANLKEAISKDIFGVPTLINESDPENMHWGQDQIDNYLNTTL
ncbi:DsbA family protein [Bacteriovoracaceae bacterium]|nr:DsbA family protein [Bacteriovoracaceae bacterium]